jgi:hypothetical protein
MEGVGWLLEKLDLIPDGIERARLEAARLRAIPVMWEWDEKSGRMVKGSGNGHLKSLQAKAAPRRPMCSGATLEQSGGWAKSRITPKAF